MPVDDMYRPLHRMVLGMDYRPNTQCEAYRAAHDEWKLYEITGQPLHPINMLSKVMWLRDNAPEAFRKAHKFITYAEYVMYRLGGEPVIDATMASRSMGYDLKRGCWSDEVLSTMGVDSSRLAEVRESGTPAGFMDSDLAATFGLKNRPVLVTGGHDQPLGAIGAGVILDGMAVDSTGTAEVLSTTYRDPVMNRQMYDSFYSCYRHAVPDMHFSFAHMQVGGILQRWYRDQLGCIDMEAAAKEGRDFYEYSQSKCTRGASPVLVLPHFNGSGTPLCDMESKGAMVGLSLSSTRYDILKGIMDSLCYELRINLDAMETAGIRISTLRAVGGGARSPMWLQTKADVTGRTIETLACKEAGCLGAAILAAAGTGCYESIASACREMVHTAQRYEPNAQSQAEYEAYYQCYRQLYPALKGINRNLNALQNRE